MNEFENIRSRIRKAHLLRSGADAVFFILMLVSGLTMSFGIFFLLDYFTDFPFYIRIVVTVLLILFFFAWLPFRHRFIRYISDVRTAAALEQIALDNKINSSEKRMSGFGAMLVSGVEFASGNNVSGSEELRKSVIVSAVDEKFNPLKLKLVNVRAILFASSLFMVCVCGVILWSVADSETLGIFLKRTLGMNSKYRTLTKIISLDVPDFTERYKTVDVSIKAEGNLPGKAFAYVTFEGTREFEIIAEPLGGEEGVYTFSILEPGRNFSFFVRAGDAESDVVKVEVVPPPVLMGGKVNVVPPEYTRRESYELPMGPLEVLTGSRLAFSAEADRALEKCVLVLADGKKLQGKAVDETKTKFEFEPFVLEKMSGYTLELTDMRGIPNRENIDYSLVALPDKLPVLTIERPLTGVYIAPVSRLRLRYNVSDDYGIGNITCHYTVKRRIDRGPSAEPEIRVIKTGKLVLDDAKGESEFAYDGQLDFKTFGMNVDDFAELVFTASDLAPKRDKQMPAEEIDNEKIIEIIMVTPEKLREMLSEEEMQAHNLLMDITDNMKFQRGILEKLLMRGSSK